MGFSEIEQYMLGYSELPEKYEVARESIEYLRDLFESFKNTTGWDGYVPYSFAFDEYTKTLRINKQRLDSTARHISHVLKSQEKERTLTPEQYKKWSKREADKHWKKYIEPWLKY
jgi:alkanesulfonate monooxygenase SsuD/methylene tetrahydromethanopterin reductase-like flavin-dependent oxidoreductase (luciferase family)